MKTRFDLENEINDLLNVADDLNLIAENILESELDEDTVVNLLIGISGMLRLKQERLMDTMCQIFKLDNYNDSNPNR